MREMILLWFSPENPLPRISTVTYMSKYYLYMKVNSFFVKCNYINEYLSKKEVLAIENLLSEIKQTKKKRLQRRYVFVLVSY